MKQWVASLMVVLWCIGLADAAEVHLHIWATGTDGHIHVAHASSRQSLDLHDFDVHEHEEAGARKSTLSDNHDHKLTVSVHTDTTRAPSASAVPEPSQKPVAYALTLAALGPPFEGSSCGTFVGGDPPQSSPGLLQHRTVVLRM